ncbi:hypothetical protein GJAV_G00241660 [Gymnothorax javanicus]|nr:hypothetical protein GJAV_G00241660 [Gymnothorax javanicus]
MERNPLEPMSHGSQGTVCPGNSFWGYTAPCFPGGGAEEWLVEEATVHHKELAAALVCAATEQLCFYKGQEDTKAQGCIGLLGCQVNELPANPEDPGHHLFEIVPGTGEKDRPALSHVTFLLMANSHTQMEDWVKAIRRVIRTLHGGGIFGQRLEDTMQLERKIGPSPAPLLVEQCVDFIRAHGLDEEGLFRMPGQANLVKELQDAFDCGEKPHFNSTTDVHTVASLLKLYLRELPEPVIPFSNYPDFLTCAQLLTKEERAGIEELEKQVKTLPQANYSLLKYICKFLDEVQTHSNQNKMSIQNLATVFGPNILRPKMGDPKSMMEGTSQVQHLMMVLIQEQARLYMGPDPEASTGPSRDLWAPSQRYAVEWVSEENLQSSSSSSTAAADPSSSTACVELHAAAPLSAVSSSKEARSLPGWRSAFWGLGVRQGSSSGEMSSTANSGKWLMNGLSSVRTYRRKSSGERSRDSAGSSLSRSISAYDYVTVSSPSAPNMAAASKGGGASTSLSSCEISLAESSANSGSSEAGVGWLPEPESRLQAGLGEGAGLDMEPGSSSMALNQSISRNVDDVSTKALSQLKAELQTQKAAYESRMQTLEKSILALGVRVETLEAELDLEQKERGMLELKLQNLERGREDGERRNRLLQREMEAFFSMLRDQHRPAMSNATPPRKAEP